MPFSFEEKKAYNEKKAAVGDEFAKGYTFGVLLYGLGKIDKKTVSEFVDNVKVFLKVDPQCSNFKGIMCGYRDAANDRKARQNKN